MQNSLIHGFEDGQREGTITIAATVHASVVHINYCDDGLGMAADTLQRVFEPFYTTRRSKGGSGLGLYIAYNLVTEALHGSIHCDSTPGAGTRFTIEYPYQPPLRKADPS